MLLVPNARRSTDGEMAKKKAPDVRQSPRKLGYLTLSVSEIRQAIESIRGELADIEGTLADAATLEIEAIELEGGTKLSRAFELIESFEANLHRGLKSTRRKNM